VLLEDFTQLNYGRSYRLSSDRMVVTATTLVVSEPLSPKNPNHTVSSI